MILAKYKITPPEGVRGMRELDRHQFTCSHPICIVRLPSVNADTGLVLRHLKKQLLKLPQLAPVQQLEQLAERLSPACRQWLAAAASQWPPTCRVACLNPQHATRHSHLAEPVRQLLAPEHTHCVHVRLDYANFDQHTVLEAVLPPLEAGCAGFSQIGHIVHVNLRQHLLPWRFVIGAVLLDKVAHARVVVNKSEPIDTTYRNFTLERLAGTGVAPGEVTKEGVEREDRVQAEAKEMVEQSVDSTNDPGHIAADDNSSSSSSSDGDYVVSVSENGCRFRLDFSRVYWNPRLATEHGRLLQQQLARGHAVYDACAGVGPFVVPAACRGCRPVLANDLNPEAVRWLRANVEAHRAASHVQCYSMCARQFIGSVVRDSIVQLVTEQQRTSTSSSSSTGGDGSPLTCHVIMNLPALAVQFCDRLVGLLAGAPERVCAAVAAGRLTLLVHVYTFGRQTEGGAEGGAEGVRRQLLQVLSEAGAAETSLGACVRETAFVRSVAPQKHMYRLTWTADAQLLCHTPPPLDPPIKRLKSQPV